MTLLISFASPFFTWMMTVTIRSSPTVPFGSKKVSIGISFASRWGMIFKNFPEETTVRLFTSSAARNAW